MNLTIKQSTSLTENLSSSSVVEALYQLTKPGPVSGLPVADAVLKGRIQVPAAYEDAVSFLNTQFSAANSDNESDFQVYVLNNNYYIRFEDPEVVRVLIAKGVIQEGEGLTVEQAATSTFGRTIFKGNQLIEHFDEFKYFTEMNQNTNIGELFSGCTNLISTDLTNIKTLYSTMCYNCNSLRYFNGEDGPEYTLSLPNLVQTLNRLASTVFAYCTQLKHITSLGIVPRLESSTFYGCTNLEDVTLPNQCVNLQTSCFRDCSKLSVINLSQLTTISDSVFQDCSLLEYCDGPSSTQGELNLPNLTGTLGNSAFKGCVKLTSIASLGSITSVGGNTFENCANLATINFPNTITSVGKNAFNNTAWYNNQPNGPVYIAKVLYKCKNASGVLVIPNNIVSITEAAFYNQSSLTSVTIGSDVASIGNGAFRDCTTLNTIVVDSSNATYDSRDNCNAIIETSSNTLIAGCQNTIIPNSVAKINGSAFANCGGLLSIIIPNSVTSIGGKAFDFSGIDTSRPDAMCLSGGITFGTGLTKIEQQTFEKAKFTSLDLPTNITTIANYAIDACGQLQSIIMRGVTSIGDKAFRGSALTTITIETPSVPTISGTSFKNDNGRYINNGNFTIYVPSNLLSSYQTTSNWSTLYNDGKILAIPTI